MKILLQNVLVLLTISVGPFILGLAVVKFTHFLADILP